MVIDTSKVSLLIYIKYDNIVLSFLRFGLRNVQKVYKEERY